MHTEVFDGNKNNIDIGRLPSKSAEIYEKNNKRESPVTMNESAASSRDTSSETIDVTTVPVTSENSLNICLNGTKSPPTPKSESTTPNHQVYTREVPPPNSIYGIESLSKPYEPELKAPLPDGIHSPRYPTNHTMVSPHHSSPDKDSTRHVHRNDNNAPWVSPVNSHPNHRGPPTSPYIDSRDPSSYPAGPPRRFVPPFYGNGRSFVHPNDRSRYGAYPIGSPLMPTLGYPREALESRYNLHMTATMGFEEDKFKLSPPSMDDKHIWTKQEVELLLDLYEEHKSKLQDPRVRKTKVWDDIAKQIHEKLEADVNGCQCNQKFRNMKADYQKVVEHNTRAGSFRKTCKYYDRLEKLLTPVSEPDKLKDEIDGESKYFNGIYSNGQNGFGSKAGTPNGNGFYEREISRNSSSPDSGENNQPYENGSAPSTTPSSPEKRPINQVETASDDASPPPSKKQCTECNCGGINKRELVEVLKEFLNEQRRREEETITKIQALHKEKIDTVVKFLDLFQELVKKV